MNANLLERVSPWPWRAMGSSVHPDVPGLGSLVTIAATWARKAGPFLISLAQARANAELIALAPDHALLLRAQRHGVRVKYLGSPLVAFSVSFVATGEDFECDEDAAGCPALTPVLREALRRAIGIEAANG